MYNGLKSSRYSCPIVMALEFSRQIFEKSSNFMTVRPEEAEFHVDRRTDMTKLIVALRSFANAHKKLVMGVFEMCPSSRVAGQF